MSQRAASGASTTNGASAAAPPDARRRTLSGWGLTAPASCLLSRPRTVQQVREALAAAAARGGGAIARGAGRSYGDAAQNGDGLVVDVTALDSIELVGGDGAPTLVRAGAGATLGALLAVLAPRGLAPPVVPGTRHITVGGAIAADIHGKNHRRDGSFGHHVLAITLCTPDGRLREVSREHEADIFHATLGGMGLTGVIVEALLAPAPVISPILDADIDRTDTLPQALEVMRSDDGGDGVNGPAGHRYSIAWVDLLSGGARFGRSVVMRSSERPQAPHARIGACLPGRPRLRVPARLPGQVLRPVVVQAFNTARWRRAPRCGRGVTVSAGENFFPLDALGAWSRLYRPHGLLQYQLVVPEHRPQAIVEILEHMRDARLPMYLAVVKRFGAGSGGLLSFPMPGWTLAVDIPASAPRVWSVLDEADEQVLAAGGRVYLAKDARMRAESLTRMYPELERFRAVRREVDPDGVLSSDMARRLGLAAEAGR